MIGSIQTVDEYVEKKLQRDQERDKRVDNLFRATMDGEQEWFLDLVRRDPDCVMKVIKECDSNDKSNV